MAREKCKHECGFFARYQVSYREYFDESGEPVGDDGGSNDRRSGRGGTVAYCEDCGARLGSMSFDLRTGRAVVDRSTQGE